MSYIKVSIKDKQTLVLESDAKKGDLISLSELMHVDVTKIEQSIIDGTNQVYLKHEEEVKNKLKLIFESELKDKLKEFEMKNNSLTLELKNLKDLTTKELEVKHLKEIQMLNKELDNLSNQAKIKENDYKNNLDNLKIKLELDSNKEKELLTSKLNELENKKILLESQLKSIHEMNRLENLNKDALLEANHKNELLVLEEELSNLKRQKSSLNVKLIGEDLEIWCDNEFNASNLVLNDNVEWFKDNKVTDKTKADFIYKVYASNEKLDNELLTSAILEMKSEDPLSNNKQDVNAILKKLDSDRVKKDMEYAILVSELDVGASNDLPIRIVKDYNKMFIVRPQYFMTLINIITAFGFKYQDILLAENEKRIEFKDIEDILNDFEILKDEILNNSVRHINKNIEDIVKQSNIISNANNKILESANIIIDRHLVTVQNKINGFKINKIVSEISK